MSNGWLAAPLRPRSAIGVVVPAITGFFGHVVEAVERIACRRVAMYLTCLGLDTDNERSAVEALLARASSDCSSPPSPRISPTYDPGGTGMVFLDPLPRHRRGSQMATIAGVPTSEFPALTHVDATGAARMVDVSDKAVSTREAVATGVLHTTAEVAELLRQGGLPKGDALATARIAGIMAAKRTPDLVPLCHPIAISGVTVDLEVDQAEVRIAARVRTADRTGVEMEALTAVAVAGLTLHDMVKAVDPAAVLDAVRVERKEGGKTGTWTRPADR